MAENPLLPDAPVVAPIAPNPNDRYSVFTKLWLCWVAAFIVIESVAVWQDKRHHDRVKRTLSSNTRTWSGWDSISGQPVEVRLGRLRRAAFVMFMAWFLEHIKGKRV